MKEKPLEVLREFMNLPIDSADAVFQKFAQDKGGKIYYTSFGKFYYKPGTRPDKILLIAHADTVWDNRYRDNSEETAGKQVNNFSSEEDSYFGENDNASETYLEENKKYYYSNSPDNGIGADDRAGAAMAWLLKDTGNSVLITDCEEVGGIISRGIVDLARVSEYKKRGIQVAADVDEELLQVADEIVNGHAFMLQFDMNGSKEFKCYSAGSEKFKTMMENGTHYKMRPNFSYTDVAFLGRKICGANLSIGYYNEHGSDEFLDKEQWLACLKVAEKICNREHTKFLVDPGFGEKYKYRPEDKSNGKTDPQPGEI